MILDALISPKQAEKKPWVMIFVGFIYAAIAMPVAYFIDKSYSSMIMVLLTVIAAMPFIYNVIKLEEKKDENYTSERKLLKEHSKAVMAFLFLFVGISFAFAMGAIFLPEEVNDNLFSAQHETIRSINAPHSLEESYEGSTNESQRDPGHIVGQCRARDFSDNFNIFLGYISHNFIVLVLALIFSFIYGLGAIYIIVWNASILGYAIGVFVTTQLANLASTGGLQAYFQSFSCGFFVRYLPHGLIEIMAYLVAGLAGAIISVAIVRHTFGTKKFTRVIADSVNLIAIAIVLLIIAAFVEAFITIDVLCVWLCE